MTEHQLTITRVGEKFASHCECGWYCGMFSAATDAALVYGTHVEREEKRWETHPDYEEK